MYYPGGDYVLLEVNEEGFHGYFVDELGNVFSNKRGNMVKLKQQKTKKRIYEDMSSRKWMCNNKKRS